MASRPPTAAADGSDGEGKKGPPRSRQPLGRYLGGASSQSRSARARRDAWTMAETRIGARGVPLAALRRAS